jgi:hypothetical protein
MLERALKRWHENLFSDTKNLEIERDKNQAIGKVSMIEQLLWWIDACRRGEVSEDTDIVNKPKKKTDSFDRALEISEEDLTYEI